jgi:hypothetical protein
MHFIYHEDHVPESVANRHRHNAKYGVWDLFVSGIERETGIAPTNVIDIASMQITNDELVALFTSASSPNYVQTGAEIHMLNTQSRYLRDTLFPESNED